MSVVPGEFSVAGSTGRSRLERARIRELRDLFHPTDFDLEVGFGPEMGTEAVELGNGWGFQAWAAANSLSADEARSGAWPYSPVEYRSDGKNEDNRDMANGREEVDRLENTDLGNENRGKHVPGSKDTGGGGDTGGDTGGGDTGGNDTGGGDTGGGDTGGGHTGDTGGNDTGGGDTGGEDEPDDPFGDLGPPPPPGNLRLTLEWLKQYGEQERERRSSENGDGTEGESDGSDSGIEEEGGTGPYDPNQE